MKSLLLIFSTALAPVIWGSTYIVTSELLPADKPFLAGFMRAFPAGLLLLLISPCWPHPKEWGKLFLLSFLNISCFQVMLFVAAYRLPSGLAAVIGAVQPLLVVGFIWRKNRLAPGWATLTCCISSVLGMSLLILSPSTVLDSVGIAAAFIGAFSMASGTYLSRQRHSSLPLLAFTGWQLLLGSLALIPAVLWIDMPIPVFSTTHIMAYGYLSMFGAFIAYALWFNGIRRISPVAVSTLGLLSPVSAVAIGWILLDQNLTVLSLIGFFVVLSSVLIVQVTASQ